MKFSSVFKVKLAFPLIVAAVALLFLALPEQASAQSAPCTGSTALFANAQLNGGGGCTREPDFYGIQMFEIHMCRSAPTPPTTTAAIVLSGCDIIFALPTGGLIEVKVGESTNIPGTATRPSPGTYTHGYILMGNSFRIEHSQQMDTTTLGDDGNAGNFCWTLTKTLTSAATAGASSTCSATAPTAAQIGTITDKLDDFGLNLFVFTAAPITAYIIKSSGFLLGTGEQALANQLVGLQVFATPVVVTETSRSLDMAFRVSQGMEVSFDATNDLDSFASGPFSAVITVK